MLEEHTPLLKGRYRLIEKVGSGVMSTVYRAEDTKRGNLIVAVKRFEATYEEDLLKEVFRRETSALRRLEHPNIVEILDYNWSPEQARYFIVLEYLPRTLADELNAHQGHLDRSWCWKLARAMAEGLQYAHGQGIIHRDLKPTNILLTAEGIPKLTDFGSSYLKTELGNAITVSSFWTPEYASPEQYRYEKATERSDIYSFGCTLYHLLSGHKPPSRREQPGAHGITPEMIRALGLSLLDARLLENMLAENPDERPESGASLSKQLEHTQEYDGIPELWLNVTRTVRRVLAETRLIPDADDELAKAFLLQEFGGDQPRAVGIRFQPDKGSLRLLTDRFVLECVRHALVPALTITGFYTTYTPELEREKQRALFVRYRWNLSTEPAILLVLRGRSELDGPLSQLFHQLQTAQQIKRSSWVRKNEQRDFTKAWNAALKLRHQQLDSAPRLTYTAWSRNGRTITFQLTNPVPDDLTWPENAALALVQKERNRPSYTAIGHVIGLGDSEVLVDSPPAARSSTSQPLAPLPKQGTIGLNLREEQSVLNRLERGLYTLQSGATVNPRLIDILMDLSQAIFEEEEEILTSYMPSLAEDKRQAVKKALAARDLFLLQGPPGTGKTTVLAEIILQILERQPDARLLVTSQSNVAVDHILIRVSEIARERGIEMVRIGREDKIGQGAEAWTLEQRQADLRTSILERTDQTLLTLKAQLHEFKRQRKAHLTLSAEETSVLEQWKARLEAVESELQGLEDDEHHLLQLLQYQEAFHSLPEGLAEIQDEYDQCEARQTERKAQITSVLKQVGVFLAETTEDTLQGSLVEEHRRLQQLISQRLGVEPKEEELTRWQQLIKDWQKVAGIGEAFAGLLLERASILAATCLVTGREYLKDREFDWAIIDEAGRATPPELLVPLVRARRAIIVGDEKQLPPMIDDELGAKELASVGVTRESLTESLFGTLVKQAQEANLPIVQMLTVQHRMHPAIGRLISQVFYEGKLENGVTEQERRHELPWISRCVTWYSTTKLPRHEETPRGSSYYNHVEVERSVLLLRHMEASYRSLGQKREVAVISPYNAQIAELRAALRPDGPDWQALHIVIAAVDAFQGQDCDIVLYTLVRSNKRASLGFLRDYRRLNVALSRARQLLLLLGDLWTLENGRESGGEENPYRGLIQYLREHEEDCAIEHLEEV